MTEHEVLRPGWLGRREPEPDLEEQLREYVEARGRTPPDITYLETEDGAFWLHADGRREETESSSDWMAINRIEVTREER